MDRSTKSFTINMGVSQQVTQPMLYVDLTTKQGEIAEEQVEDETKPQETNNYLLSTLPKVSPTSPSLLHGYFGIK